MPTFIVCIISSIIVFIISSDSGNGKHIVELILVAATEAVIAMVVLVIEVKFIYVTIIKLIIPNVLHIPGGKSFSCTDGTSL